MARNVDLGIWFAQSACFLLRLNLNPKFLHANVLSFLGKGGTFGESKLFFPSLRCIMNGGIT